MPFANSTKVVLPELLDTWTLGPRFIDQLTDLGPALEGEACDIPTPDEGTVNTTETASPEAVTLGTDPFLCDRTKFINVEIKHRESLQLLRGQYKEQVMRARLGRLWNAIQRDLIEYWVQEVAAATAANHLNIAADAITDDDVNAWDALHAETAGVDSEARLILASPSAVAAFKNTAAYAPFQAAPSGNLGIGRVGSVNEIPLLQYKGVPGNTNPYGVATSAVSVASNVATATVASGHGLPVGQLIYTTGLTSNVPKASATAITESPNATTVKFALTAGDGALADGVGTIWTASGMAILLHLPWCFFASDSYSKTAGAGIMPDMTIVERSDAAGQALKIVAHIGRKSHDGAVKILHTPLAA